MNDMNRKIQTSIILLSIGTLFLSGCGTQKLGKVSDTERVKDTELIIENVDTEENTEEAEAVEAETEEATEVFAETLDTEMEEASAESDPKQQNGSEGQSQQPKPQSGGSVQGTSQQQEAAVIQPDTVEVQESAPVSYSPQTVVELAVEKTKSQGKIYIPDDLDQMLAAGTISQEEYNASYPTDGAGYLEYYVATDLNEARDVSGSVHFSSEADIAANIAGMYASLPQQYFYIEYHGTVMYGEKECYVFYCYRA